MKRLVIHTGYTPTQNGIIKNYSLEATARDLAELAHLANRICPGTSILLPYLPGQNNIVRLTAAQTIRRLGFEPVLHFSARRITSFIEFENFLRQAVALAGIQQCLVVAGDLSTPAGPFADSASMIETGLFEKVGIQTIGVCGHPAGHPIMTEAQCWRVLQRKCFNIMERGMAPKIVTQFDFDADGILMWLKTLRECGVDCPVRIGVPGPTRLASLIRFAHRCGVKASASVLTKYGISIGKLLSNTGSDQFIHQLSSGLKAEHGSVRLHFYPFGGIEKTTEWIEQYTLNH